MPSPLMHAKSSTAIAPSRNPNAKLVCGSIDSIRLASCLSETPTDISRQCRTEICMLRVLVRRVNRT